MRFHAGATRPTGASRTLALGLCLLAFWILVAGAAPPAREGEGPGSLAADFGRAANPPTVLLTAAP